MDIITYRYFLYQGSPIIEESRFIPIDEEHPKAVSILADEYDRVIGEPVGSYFWLSSSNLMGVSAELDQPSRSEIPKGVTRISQVKLISLIKREPDQVLAAEMLGAIGQDPIKILGLVEKKTIVFTPEEMAALNVGSS